MKFSYIWLKTVIIQCSKKARRDFQVFYIQSIFSQICKFSLVKLDKNHQNYQLMIERKEHHDKKQRYVLSKLKSKGYQALINITDTQINDLSLESIKQQHNINNRDIFRGGRTEYYYNIFYNLYTLNDNQCLKGLDYTSMMLQNLPLRGLVVGKDWLNYWQRL
ncbi:Conserved_hypothetical protein [Hexamita inflata]|uniref:Uncharacterized protein n=1 Tax=Hexamita inflata TaxID=28002 RepID=A0ABP1IAP2_9EUKA